MSLQACVERLFALNSNYLYPEQAFNQASSLRTLSDDLYTDPFRFVYELVQNADDASSKHLQITLIEKDYLIISHNGKIFDEKDVRSLCAVNNSTKIHNSQTAGYKGLGFKAIFGKSSYVLIATSNEYFRFDKEFKFTWTWTDIDRETWERNNERIFLYPWQICPIWTETQQIPESIRTWLSNNKMPVNIIIRLHNVEETRNALEELAIQPHTFLFLRHIRQVEFRTSTIGIEKRPDGSVRLSYNKNQSSQWLVSRREILVPPGVLNDIRLPEKLRQVRSTEIGLAAKLDSNNGKTFVPVSNSDSVLFAYMPTKISTYNLPVLVNANFLTNANREQIHTDSIWNQWLFECIPRETIEWIKELIKKSNYANTAYDLLPMPTRGKDILAKKYDESCSTAMTNTKFICNTHGEYLTLGEAVVDLTRLSNQPYIGTEPIRQYIVDQRSSHATRVPLHPFIPDNRRLRELDVQVFEWHHAIDMFNSKIFQENFSINRDIQLISYLFDQRADEEISELLHRIPFIMDRNKRLHIPTNIYFPSELNDVSWHSPDCREAYVHYDLIKGLQPQHRHWLEQLGVTIKTDLTFFLRTIIPRASTFITYDTALPTIQRLFFLFKYGQITFDHVKSVGELSLLTTTNTLVPANRLYLSSYYEPHLPLDTELPAETHLFVSPTYMNVQDTSPMEWKYFFLLLGVQQKIDLMTLNDNCRLLQNYHEDQMRIIFGLNSQPVHGYKYRKTLSLLEYTEGNFPFAQFFWQQIILQRIDVCTLNQTEMAYWGAKNRRGATYGSEVNTFPQWFIRTRRCIPVRISLAKGQYKNQCLKAPEVFTGHLRSLIGHYLPIFDCIPTVELLTPEWQKFFRFKTELSIDDYLFILKQIYLQNENGIDVEDETRVQDIYVSLLIKLSEIDQNQREFYREKSRSMNLCLLSTSDNLFMPPEELVFWSIDTYPAPLQLYTLKLNKKCRQHPHLSHLLYVLNINQIRMNDLNLIPINANSCDELTNRLQKCYLLLLLDFHKIKKIEILNQLDHIRFFEADQLELNIDTPNTCVGHPQVYVKNNCLYTVKPWNSPLVLTELSTRICELLSLPIHLFEVHVRTLLTTFSIDDYFIQLGIFPANEDLSIDPFANLIERNNLELFNRLQDLPPLYTSGQLLIAALEAQSPHWTGYIYHYTHLENAVSILRNQSLKSRHLLQTNNFKDSSPYDFMSQTDDQVNHYARFYFRPRTLTQLNNENLGSERSKKRNNYTPMCPVPIFFCINLQEILNIPNIQWKISLGDMSNDRTEYDCTLDVIKRFDFCGLFKGVDTERGKRSAQLEFLIENQLDFRCLSKDAITLICQNSDAKTSLEYMLTEQSMQIYNLGIKKADYFFGKNSLIFINHDKDQDYISVMIDCRETHRTGGMLIVQIISNPDEENIDLACNGDICATFYYDRITTVYGKEKPLKIFVGRRAYAVYYKYEQQVWLIYTNHERFEFDSSHHERHPEFMPYD